MATFVKQADVPVDELKPHPDNPNRGSVKDIGTSLEEFGQFRSIVALEDGTILAGHHVWEATKRIGKETIRVDYIAVENDAEARKIMLADNRLADLGLGPDLDLLLENLEKLDGDLMGTGFDTEYIQMLEEATAGAPDLDDLEDEVGPPPAAEFYRRLTITVDPKLVTKWETYRKDYDDDNHAFADLMGIGEEELGMDDDTDQA